MSALRSGRHIADLIDALIEAEKSLIGEPLWHEGNRVGEEERLDWPVLVNGESVNCKVSITAYPNLPYLRYTITLNYEDRNIWRVDHESPDRVELNPFRVGHELNGLRVIGPHCHTWADNKGDATPATIPDPLPWRRPLPDNTRSFDSTFRWFLGEVNVDQPVALPALPNRTRFL